MQAASEDNNNLAAAPLNKLVFGFILYGGYHIVAGENFGELIILRVWRGKLWRIAMNYLYFLQFNDSKLN